MQPRSSVFNSVYGSDSARDYIQIHFTRAIIELNGSAPDIEMGYSYNRVNEFH